MWMVFLILDEVISNFFYNFFFTSIDIFSLSILQPLVIILRGLLTLESHGESTR